MTPFNVHWYSQTSMHVNHSLKGRHIQIHCPHLLVEKHSFIKMLLRCGVVKNYFEVLVWTTRFRLNTEIGHCFDYEPPFQRRTVFTATGCRLPLCLLFRSPNGRDQPRNQANIVTNFPQRIKELWKCKCLVSLWANVKQTSLRRLDGFDFLGTLFERTVIKQRVIYGPLFSVLFHRKQHLPTTCGSVLV